MPTNIVVSVSDVDALSRLAAAEASAIQTWLEGQGKTEQEAMYLAYAPIIDTVLNRVATQSAAKYGGLDIQSILNKPFAYSPIPVVEGVADWTEMPEASQEVQNFVGEYITALVQGSVSRLASYQTHYSNPSADGEAADNWLEYGQNYLYNKLIGDDPIQDDNQTPKTSNAWGHIFGLDAVNADGTAAPTPQEFTISFDINEDFSIGAGETSDTITPYPLEGLPVRKPDYLGASAVDLDNLAPGVGDSDASDVDHGLTQNIVDLFNAAITYFSPVVLDLDNDGIELLSLESGDAVFWDADMDGVAEASGWVNSDDGILAADLNQDGIINDASELFGDQTGFANGFLALAAYDVNADGQVTAEDFGFNDLLVWRDLNTNGYSEGGEMFSLSDLSITALSTGFVEVSYLLAENDIRQESTFVRGGVTQDMVDAYFATNQAHTVYNENFIVDWRVLELPNAKSYGDLSALYIAMSLDNDGGDPDSLISLVAEFSGLSAAEVFSGSALDAVKDILFRWAGVDAVSPTARGANVDARELAFLEKMTGQEFRQWGWNPNPYPDAGRDLTRAFQMALNHVYGVLASQTEAGAELFGAGAFYNIAADALDGFTALDAGALDALETAAAGLANNSAREEFWTGVVRVVEYALGVSGISGGDEAALDAAIYDSGLTLEDTDSLLALATGNTNAPVFAPTYGTSGADTGARAANDNIVISKKAA